MKRIRKFLFRFFALAMLAMLVAGSVLGGFGYKMYRDALAEQPLDQKVAEIQADPNYTTLAEIPEIYLDAVVAVEDHRFEQHFGIDLIAIGRAAWNNLTSWSLREGGSTITQQLAKNLYFTQEKMTHIICSMREKYPDCAITLSIGEREREEYEAYFAAGANRFLLRHETANEAHYRTLHPAELDLTHRKACLRNLKKIGYQVGSGIMVGSPGQTAEHLAEDLLFLKELNPHMIGIGPFIPQKDTPFREEKAGTLELTLFLLGLLRLMLPKVLLPSTTALSTIHPDGRKMGILAGANVVMPNLSPQENRKLYSLYDNKRSMGDEAAEGLALLKAEMESIGYRVVSARGDSLVE